jgi:hypothetical protein
MVATAFLATSTDVEAKDARVREGSALRHLLQESLFQSTFVSSHLPQMLTIVKSNYEQNMFFFDLKRLGY